MKKSWLVLSLLLAARTASLAVDIRELELIMADDVTYIHASGKVDTKKSYLDDSLGTTALHFLEGAELARSNAWR